jgi:hypothetical protein
MRREIITWSVVAAIVLGAFAGTVLILNSTLYSAAGFVRGYLDTLARRDAAGALEMVGEIRATDVSTELLTADAMGELDDIRLLSDTAEPSGVHTVVYSWSAAGAEGETSFQVVRSGTLLGLFSTWEFYQDPLGVMQVTVLHGTEFTANGVDLVAPQQDVPSSYLAFAPGSYELAHDSLFLSAEQSVVTVARPGAAVIAPVDLQPTAAFVDQVSEELNEYLDECATQTVLLPTGCPFGQPMGNRIISTPVWSITSYPEVTLVPGPEPASWFMPPTEAAAHLVVDVRSIFDGSVSVFDEDVPFTTSYLVTFLSDRELLITAQ